MEELDLRLKMLANVPILLDGISIYPVSVRQIAEFGYMEYNQALKILCIGKQDLKSLINEEISPFEFLQMSMLFDPKIEEQLRRLILLICKNKAVFSEEKQGFIIGEGVLHKDNFDEFVNIIRIANCLDVGNITENPSNEKAKILLEKRRNIRNKIRRNNRSGSDDGLNLHDLVSIVSTGLRLPINEVLEYSVYQLSDALKRLISKENYDTSIYALIQGANKNDLDLKHWTQK